MAGLRNLIEGVAHRPGVIAVALVSTDGLVIDRVVTGSLDDHEEVAALSATVAAQAASLGLSAGRGSFQTGVMEYQHGMVIVSRAGDEGFLVVLVDPEHNVGELLYHLRQHEPALAALL
jgi:predicted regulator of Ras-like GTPase activity (Roadblock/LC7/MglB family)